MRTLPERDTVWPRDSALGPPLTIAPETGRPSLRRLVDRLTADRAAMTVLRVLMLANALFALLHALRFGLLWLGAEPDGPWTHDRLSLGMEWGYAEILKYCQTLALVGLLAATARRSRERLYGCWAAVFLLVAIDDALAIHQQFGSLLATLVPLPPRLGLRPANLGEVTVWLGGALGVVALLTFGFRRTAAAHREIGWYFAWLFGLLLFFGVAVDVVHSLMSGTFFGASLLLELIEDGGEMISISLACALAVAVWRATDLPAAGAWGTGPARGAPGSRVLDRIRRHGGL